MKIKNLHDAVIAVANSLNGNITNSLDELSKIINSVEVNLGAEEHIAINHLIDTLKGGELQEQLNKTITQRNELAAMLDAALGDNLPQFLAKWKPSETLMDAPFDSLMGK